MKNAVPPPTKESPTPNIRQIFGSRLGHTARRWRRAMDEQLLPFGLTEATWLPLLYVSRAGAPLRQKDLAEIIGIEGSTLVRLIDALDKARLIERQTDEDRRAKLISLTSRGRAVVKRVEAAAVTIRQRTLAGINDAELAVTLKVLERVCAALDSSSSLPDSEDEP